MEGWFANGNAQKVVLKEKSKRIKVEVPQVSSQSLEQGEELTLEFKENPFQQQLINYQTVIRSQQMLDHSNTKFGAIDLTLLEREVSWVDNEEETDEHWEFKTLRSEISAVLNSLYDFQN